MPRAAATPSVVAATQEVFERAKLTPKQLRIWEIVGAAQPESLTLIGYGGAAGGGKTRALAELGIDLALDFPGNRILIGRKDYSDLRDTTMEQFLRSCPPSVIVERNQTEHWFKLRLAEWPEGLYSIIFFRELKDYLGIASQEYGAILIDEAGEVPSNSARMLLSRLRWKLPTGQPVKYILCAASNPWPGWFKDWFVERTLPEDTLATLNARVYFIPALAKDNPYLPENYEAGLRAIYPADWVQRLMDGRWDAFVGQVYPQFNADLHEWKWGFDVDVLGTPKAIPSLKRGDVVRVIGGLDFGGHNPHAHMSAGTVALVLRSGRIVTVGEFEERGANVVDRQMLWMLKMQEYWATPETGPIHWMADRSQMLGIRLWRKQGFTIRQTKGGPDSVEMGIAMVGRRMDADPSRLPGMYYLPALTKLPERLTAYRYQEPTSDDAPAKRLPLKVNDDLCDAFRYMHEAVDKFSDPREIGRRILPVIGGSTSMTTTARLAGGGNGIFG